MRAKEESLLIALSGGSPQEREAIAHRLLASGKGLSVEFNRRTPKACYGAQRLSQLRSGLGMSAPRKRAVGTVVTHCLSEQEARLVREQGGVVWHLYNKPSSFVVMRNGDPVVADGEDGFAHVRSPLEALSELILAQAG